MESKKFKLTVSYACTPVICSISISDLLTERRERTSEENIKHCDRQVWNASAQTRPRRGSPRLAAIQPVDATHLEVVPGFHLQLHLPPELLPRRERAAEPDASAHDDCHGELDRLRDTLLPPRDRERVHNLRDRYEQQLPR